MLEGDIVTFLRADANCAAAFSTRIYVGQTPDNPTLPYATVRTITAQREGRPEIQPARIQINNYANTYTDALTHAGYLNARLHGYFGSMSTTNIIGCWMDSQTPLYDAKLKKNYVASDYIITTR